MRFALVAIATSAVVAVPAKAQDSRDPPAPVTVSGSVRLLTEYRDRGLSQTDGGIALQGNATVEHRSGFYASGFAANIDGSGAIPDLLDHGGVELNAVGGYSADLVGGFGVDAGLIYNWYPDARRGLATDFFEPFAALTYSLGPLSARARLTYAWGGQEALGGDDSIYASLDVSGGLPATPITLRAHLGYTDGSEGAVNPEASDTYWDWSLTGEYARGPFTVGVRYIDTDVSNRGGFARSLGRGATVLAFAGIAF